MVYSAPLCFGFNGLFSFLDKWIILVFIILCVLSGVLQVFMSDSVFNTTTFQDIIRRLVSESNNERDCQARMKEVSFLINLFKNPKAVIYKLCKKNRIIHSIQCTFSTDKGIQQDLKQAHNLYCSIYHYCVTYNTCHFQCDS